MDNKVFTYREFGISPIAHFDYSFVVSEDYRCQMTFDIKNDKVQAHEETEVVQLNPEEKKRVHELCRQMYIHPAIEPKKVDRGSSFETILHMDEDKIFREDLFFKKLTDDVVGFIRSNHSKELGTDVVRDLYISLTNKVYGNNYSTGSSQK